MFFYDFTVILIIPAMILAVFAQIKVKSSYSKYSSISNQRGITGAEAARRILDSNGLHYVPIEMTAGQLTDHYDPRSRVMRLSNGVYNSRSIAAISIAAHESGHAIQHSQNYAALTFRNMLAPVTSIASNAAWPLAIIGLLLGATYGVGSIIFNIGLLLYAIAVLFQVVTLPVELNASSRALQQLSGLGLVTEEQDYRAAKKMLSAAALTYVAAMAVAIANLLRLILIRGNRN